MKGIKTGANVSPELGYRPGRMKRFRINIPLPVPGLVFVIHYF